MSFLMLPTFMSFVSSTIGTICLAFTEFEFNHKFFFRPLIIVMFVSYWYGCWFLPTVLAYLDFDFMKLGAEKDEEVVAQTKQLSDDEPQKEAERGSSDLSSQEKTHRDVTHNNELQDA
eukprot:scaffold22137_cov164-Amphora_coffeaeformis.AAC.3